jgi:flagellar hook-length control protein FliK
MEKIASITIESTQVSQQTPEAPNPEIFAMLLDGLFKNSNTDTDLVQCNSLEAEKKTNEGGELLSYIGILQPPSQNLQLDVLSKKLSPEMQKSPLQELAAEPIRVGTADKHQDQKPVEQPGVKGLFFEVMPPKEQTANTSARPDNMPILEQGGEEKLIKLTDMVKELTSSNAPAAQAPVEESTKDIRNDSISAGDGSIRTIENLQSQDAELIKADIVNIRFNIVKLEDSIVKNIAAVNEGEHTVLKVKLEPENLGKVNLDLTFENGKLTAKINVENNQIRELFKESIGQLHQGLQKHNIQVGKIQLEVSPGNDGAHADLGKQSSFRHNYKKRSFSSEKALSISNVQAANLGYESGKAGLNVYA